MHSGFQLTRTQGLSRPAPRDCLIWRMCSMLEERAPEVMKAIRHSWVRVITSFAERSLRKINYRKVPGTIWFLLCLGQLGHATEKPAGPFKVLCSFYPMYVMALNVVGDTPGVEVECLTEPMVGCLHDYQLTPANLK